MIPPFFGLHWGQLSQWHGRAGILRLSDDVKLIFLISNNFLIARVGETSTDRCSCYEEKNKAELHLEPEDKFL
jgi:hypothetical protein